MHKTLGRGNSERRKPVLFSLGQDTQDWGMRVLRQELRVYNGLDRSLGPIKAWNGITSNLIILRYLLFQLHKKVGCHLSSEGSPALQMPQALLHADLHHLSKHLLCLATTVFTVYLGGNVGHYVLERVWLQP